MINDSQSTPTPGQPTTRHPQLPWIVAAVALALIILVVLLVRSSQPSASVGAAGPVDNGAELLVAAERERQALAKTKLQTLHDQSEEINGTLKQAEAELIAWREKVEPELKGPKGRALAADTDAVRKFSEVYELPRPTDEEIRACRARVSTLLEPAEKALSTSAALYVPDDAVGKQLQTERNFATDALRSARNARQTAEALLAEASPKGAGGSRTLQEAMDQAKRGRTQELAAAMAVKQEVAEREAAERVANAKAEQTKQLGEAEAQKIDAETKRKAEAVRAETESLNAKAEQDRLKLLAARPDIQAKYRPFLEKGRFRMNPEKCAGERMDKPGPMSYSDLKALGVLDNHQNFANAGAAQWPCRKGCCYPNQNDRPGWGRPNSQEEFDKYRDRFAEFVQLAPIWAETGVLDP